MDQDIKSNSEPESVNSLLEAELDGHDPGNLLRNALSEESGPVPGGEWEPPEPQELSALIEGFEVTAILGRGGMGAVYEGTQESLDRKVAIKLLPPELGADPEFEARFRREAKSMAQLSHTNIVQIYDFGKTSQGHHYFVMEHVDGLDLHELIRGGSLDETGVLNAISQICDALEYAHGEGFVHRDIKPANIFINHAGILKVGDFGLAKLVETTENASRSELLGLTMTGVAMGTPNYVAPEQLAEGYAVDHRADIYSLGVMFYEMLTGDIPRGAVKLPSQRVKNLDRRIDDVVFRAMETKVDERYQSAADLRNDVDVIRTTEFSYEKTPNPGPNTKFDKKWALLGGGAAVPLLILAGLIVGVAKFPQDKPPLLADAKNANSEEKTNDLTTSSAPQKKPPASSLSQNPPPLEKREVEPVVGKAVGEEGGDATSVVEGPSKIGESVATQPSDTVTKNTSEDVSNSPTASLAEKARREKMNPLADNYDRALAAQIDSFAEKGDLISVKAFQQEQEAIARIRATLADAEVDPKDAAQCPPLAELADSVPQQLVQLRQTWLNECAKIDQSLGQGWVTSLKSLQVELTRSKNFEAADSVLKYREILFPSVGGENGAQSALVIPTRRTALGSTSTLKDGMRFSTRFEEERKKGGKLQLWVKGGKMDGRYPFDRVFPEEFREMDDVLEVGIDRLRWAAIRDRSVLISCAAIPSTGEVRKRNQKVKAHYFDGLFLYFYLDDKLANVEGSQWANAALRKRPIFASLTMNEFSGFDSSGQTQGVYRDRIKTKGNWEEIRVSGENKELYKNTHTLVSSVRHTALIDKSGKLWIREEGETKWNGDTTIEDGLAELHSCDDLFVGRYSDGRVILFDMEGNLPKNHGRWDQDKLRELSRKRAVRIAAGGGVIACQDSEGEWGAFGAEPFEDSINQINSIGKAIDLDVYGNHVIWIEPASQLGKR